MFSFLSHWISSPCPMNQRVSFTKTQSHDRIGTVSCLEYSCHAAVTQEFKICTHTGPILFTFSCPARLLTQSVHSLLISIPQVSENVFTKEIEAKSYFFFLFEKKAECFLPTCKWRHLCDRESSVHPCGTIIVTCTYQLFGHSFVFPCSAFWPCSEKITVPKISRIS